MKLETTRRLKKVSREDFYYQEEQMKNKSDHTVEYTSIDYHSMCERSKDRIKKMQAQGIPTPHDPKDKPEDVGKSNGYSIFFMS